MNLTANQIYYTYFTTIYHFVLVIPNRGKVCAIKERIEEKKRYSNALSHEFGGKVERR